MAAIESVQAYAGFTFTSISEPNGFSSSSESSGVPISSDSSARMASADE